MSRGGPSAAPAPAGASTGGGFGAWMTAVDRRAAELSGAARGWAANRVVLSGLGSTNALARRVVDEYLAEEIALPTAVFVAWEQTAGRGRQGRAWRSPPGAGAWVTLVQPIAAGDELSLLPLVVPLGLSEALDRHLPADRPCRIKWPNDLVVAGGKIGGVLIDGVTPRAGAPGAAVVGFGVNLLQGESDLAPLGGTHGPTRAATSLTIERGGEVDAPAVLWDLVEGVAARLAAPAGAAAVVAAYERRSLHRPGEPLHCRSGEETLSGRFRGFDEQGFLRLELTAPGAGREVGDEILMRAGEVVG